MDLALGLLVIQQLLYTRESIDRMIKTEQGGRPAYKYKKWIGKIAFSASYRIGHDFNDTQGFIRRSVAKRYSNGQVFITIEFMTINCQLWNLVHNDSSSLEFSQHNFVSGTPRSSSSRRTHHFFFLPPLFQAVGRYTPVETGTDAEQIKIEKR
jgi:hypothetical protein